jgi:hypothetical protein
MFLSAVWNGLIKPAEEFQVATSFKTSDESKRLNNLTECKCLAHYHV